jgi:histidinol dehydrogenase
MEIIINPEKEKWAGLCKRPEIDSSSLDNMCREIFWQVEKYKDEALFRYTSLFDKINLTSFAVSKEEISRASGRIPEKLVGAIALASQNISTFHKSQVHKPVMVTTSQGVECWQESRPVERVGIYIPGGSAPLFSSVLMMAIPAKIAGCREIILCSPPDREGKIADEILYTADLCGIENIYKIGGIQAIAALSLGTESIPKVDKIFGPGNQYVTAAKLYAQKLGIAIDMPAGPSEVLVMADENAIPDFVAVDLLSQAEHGADSQVMLVSTSIEFIRNVNEKVYMQLDELPRKNIAEKAIQASKMICLPDKEGCLGFINMYAPEHLILSVKDEDFYLNGLLNAGSVFIGNFTPESAGDYASGTNHTLPTNGFARAYSGLNLDSFTKKISFQKISRQGLQNIGKAIETMAEAEGLQAHKNAVSLRLKSEF